MQIINRRPPTSARRRRQRRTRHAGLLSGTALVVALVAGGGGSSGVTAAHINASTSASSSSTTAGNSSSRGSVAHASSTTSAKRSTTPATNASPLAFAKCMRQHGVPNFPDPKPPGQLPATHITQAASSSGFTANPNSPAYQTASKDCRSLAVATPVTQAVANQVMTAQLKFASCMRANGVPNFPDPTSNGEIGNNGAISGVNENSPAFQSAEKKCSKFMFHPPGLPGSGSSASQPGG
jgi:hypothetical protein